MDGLEAAESERQRGQARGGGREPEEPGIRKSGCREELVVQPHGEAVGRRYADDGIEQPVSGVERGNVAFREQGETEPEAIASEREPSLGQEPCEFLLERPVETVGIVADRLDPDQKARQEQRRQSRRQDLGRPEPAEIRVQQEGLLINIAPLWCEHGTMTGRIDASILF